MYRLFPGFNRDISKPLSYTSALVMDIRSLPCANCVSCWWHFLNTLRWTIHKRHTMSFLQCRKRHLHTRRHIVYSRRCASHWARVSLWRHRGCFQGSSPGRDATVVINWFILRACQLISKSMHIGSYRYFALQSRKIVIMVLIEFTKFIEITCIWLRIHAYQGSWTARLVASGLTVLR